MRRTLSLLLSLAALLAALVPAPTHAPTHVTHAVQGQGQGKTTESTKTTTAQCGSDAECAALDAARGWHSEGTPGGPRVRMALDDSDPRWVCWIDGNGRCSTTPLAHR